MHLNLKLYLKNKLFYYLQHQITNKKVVHFFLYIRLTVLKSTIVYF